MERKTIELLKKVFLDKGNKKLEDLKNKLPEKRTLKIEKEKKTLKPWEIGA